MKDLGIESMLPETHLTSSADIDCRGLTASDQRRLIVHYTAEMVHQVLQQSGANPLGVVVTTELIEDPSRGAPKIRVAATAPRYRGSGVFGM